MKMQLICVLLLVAMSFVRGDITSEAKTSEVSRAIQMLRENNQAMPASDLHAPNPVSLGQSETVDSFDWTQVEQIHTRQQLHGMEDGVDLGWNWWPPGQRAAVWAANYGKEPLVLNLRTLGPSICSKITSNRYAIVSKLGCENIPQGSFLEMLSVYASEDGGPETSFSTRTAAESGPNAQIEGTDPNRDLVLPFDSTGIKGRLIRIALNLRLTGRGSLHMADSRLVQYPGATNAPAIATNPGPNPQSASTPTAGYSIDWKSFASGAITALGIGAFAASISILRRLLKRRAHEKELRRIESIDG